MADVVVRLDPRPVTAHTDVVRWRDGRRVAPERAPARGISEAMGARAITVV